MLRTYITAFLFVSCLGSSHGQGSSHPETGNREKATEQIKALRDGALVVRLNTDDRSVEAYRNAGKTELADKIAAERAALNQKLVDAFSYYFSFCKVYFIYSKNTDALLKRQSGIFLNDKMQPDSSIRLTEKFFLIAEYGSYTQNERVDDYHYSGVYETQPSTSTASTSAIVILDTTLTQLQEPFPFQEPVYVGSFIKGAEELSKRLDNGYERLLYKKELKELKKNGNSAK